MTKGVFLTKLRALLREATVPYQDTLFIKGGFTLADYNTAVRALLQEYDNSPRGGVQNPFGDTPEEAAAVERMVQWKANGLSYRAISRLLANEKIFLSYVGVHKVLRAHERAKIDVAAHT